MLDSETRAKNYIESKKHPRVVRVLKEFIGIPIITKRILDLGVNLIVSELLALVFVVEKQLTNTISKDEVIQFCVNSLDLDSCQKVTTSHILYSIGLSKTKVRLKDDFKVMLVLYIEAEINVMIREVMENIGLAMRQGFRLELVSHTGYSQPFLGPYKDIEVAVDGLKTRHPIFFVKHGDHHLVLR